MGYLIDLLYLVREIVKLAFMVMISPFGLVAVYLLGLVSVYLLGWE